MAKVDLYFDNTKVSEDVVNWRDLEIEVNFDEEEGQGVIKSGQLEFTGSLARKINTWNDQGMSGGVGIFEGPPFRIEACSGSVVFGGCINTAECNTSYECDKVVAPLRSNKIDFINDRASSFSPAYLASLPPNQPGKITTGDYILIPYIINTIPDYVNVMVAGISLYAMIKELEEVGEKTKAVIQEVAGDTVMTTTSSLPTVNVGIGMAVGRVLVDILRITFYILYLLLIIQFIIQLIQMIFDNLIQRVKYKKAMRIITLFQRCSTYLGMSFSSTLLTGTSHKNDVIIPRKTAFDKSDNKNATTIISQTMLGAKTYNRKDYDDAINLKSTGYYDGTFADLILGEELRLNAELRIIGNTLHFETKEFFANTSNYIIPNIKNKNGDPHGTNACQLASNYIISYTLDDIEENTYDQYTGTSCQMQIVPSAILNKRNILLKNLTEIILPYSLAKIKTDLSAVEQVVSALYDVADAIYSAITGFFNSILSVINGILSAISTITGGTPPQIPLLPAFPPNPINARIGMMVLSSDFIGVQKVLSISSTPFSGSNVPFNAFKPHSNNVSLTAARTLMDDLHFTNFAIRKITTNGIIKNDHNQWLTYTDKEIPFCCDDYNKLLNNNFCKTYDQKLAKVKSLVWKPDKNTARITYMVKQQYTNNLNQSYIIDGRQ